MQIKQHEFSRLKKSDQMYLCFNTGDSIENTLAIKVSRKDFEKSAEHYLKNDLTVAIYEGINYFVILHKPYI